MNNYYDLLGCERSADLAAVKKAFKKAALIHHPDKGGTDEMFQKINQAWIILGDETKRARYDRVSKTII
jgi:curved DNA-binding protein CbpA